MSVADAFLERFEVHGDRLVRNVGTGRDLCGTKESVTLLGYCG
jgi:hypothetical protein